MSKTSTTRVSAQARTSGRLQEPSVRAGRRVTAGPNMNDPGHNQTYGTNRPNNQGSRPNITGSRAPQQQAAATDREGQYAGGFTVFPPDEQKRHQINRMAQREAQAYEDYKQANAEKHFSYVGAVGGGHMSEDQVRARQATAVRNQKFNRLAQQREHLEAKKRREEMEVENMRSEARRKAEQNAASQDRMAPAAEVRRNREAFLQQLENRATVPPQENAGRSGASHTTPGPKSRTT